MSTATARARPTAAPRRRDGPATSTGTLVRFMLRRDRVRLPAWAAGFALFVVYLATALPQVAETEEELRGTTQLFGDPVGRLLIGPGYGFDDPTFAQFLANGYGLYFLLLAALMSILLVSRHTRMEEQTGRAELVRANVVGRHAPLTATLVVAVVNNLAVGVVVVATMTGVGGYEAEGSLLFAVGIAAFGLAFAGVTALTVQLTEYSRGAAGMAGVVLGVAFVLRAGGDMAEQGGGALSWASPLGWGQQTAPFVLDRWWPLALVVALAGVSAGVGFVLAARRDLGASLVAVRPGRARAAPYLGSPWGLALRLQRASILGWAAALAVGGLAFGAYTEALITALEDLPDVFIDLFGGAEEMVAGYLAYMAVFMSYVVAAFAILAVQSLRAEETRGRAEPILATPVSRRTWLATNLGVTAAAVVVLMAVIGAATGIGAAIVTGDGHHIGDLLLAHLNHVPAVLVVLGVAALLFGVLPRAIAVTWVIVGYGLVVGTFGPMLELPDAAYDLSPFEHAAQLPLEEFALAPLLVAAAVALATAVIGWFGLRRRGINVA